MADFDEAIYQERERELIRRLGVTEAALEVASAEILRKDEQLRALGEELSQAKGSARHWEGVFREHDGKYGTLYQGLLVEWAEGCSAETLAWLALPRDDEAKPEHWDALRALFAADTALHFGGRCRPSSDDVNRLRTLILRRLDGAERAQTLAEHWQNVGTLCPLSAAGRELKEALDG